PQEEERLLASLETDAVWISAQPVDAHFGLPVEEGEIPNFVVEADPHFHRSHRFLIGDDHPATVEREVSVEARWRDVQHHAALIKRVWLKEDLLRHIAPEQQVHVAVQAQLAWVARQAYERIGGADAAFRADTFPRLRFGGVLYEDGRLGVGGD